jgi:hypothetical protein
MELFDKKFCDFYRNKIVCFLILFLHYQGSADRDAASMAVNRIVISFFMIILLRRPDEVHRGADSPDRSCL